MNKFFYLNILFYLCNEFKTKIMKTYLKTSGLKFYTAFAAFDHDNLTSVSVSKGSFDFDTNYDDLQHLSEKIKSYLVDAWEICTRQEFDNFYKEQSIKLNKISKEL